MTFSESFFAFLHPFLFFDIHFLKLLSSSQCLELRKCQALDHLRLCKNNLLKLFLNVFCLAAEVALCEVVG